DRTRAREFAWRNPCDARAGGCRRSEEHTSELQSHLNLVCRLLLEKKKERGSRRVPEARPGVGRAMSDETPMETRWRGLPAGETPEAHAGTLVRRFFFHDPAANEIYALSLHDAILI